MEDEEERHEWLAFALKNEWKMLRATKETDKNLRLLRKGDKMNRALTDKVTIKAENKAKYAAVAMRAITLWCLYQASRSESPKNPDGAVHFVIVSNPNGAAGIMRWLMTKLRKSPLRRRRGRTLQFLRRAREEIFKTSRFRTLLCKCVVCSK